MFLKSQIRSAYRACFISPVRKNFEKQNRIDVVDDTDVESDLEILDDIKPGLARTSSITKTSSSMQRDVPSASRQPSSKPGSTRDGILPRQLSRRS